MHVSTLPYASVDPDHLGPWAPASARDALAAVVEEATGDLDAPRLREGWDRDKLEEAMSLALVEALGPWASGFRWAATEPGGGGPVTSYCCAEHSLLRETDPSARESIERVVRALEEWRSFLVELGARFAALRAETASWPRERQVETAATRLLPWILERTSADDAWYHTFATVLAWYLGSLGIGDAAIRDLIEQIASGRFRSWVAPSDDTARAAATELGLDVAIAIEALPPKPVDALEIWATRRADAFHGHAWRWHLPSSGDGHSRFIEGPEMLRDAPRARRMASALAACRGDARTARPLDFAMLASWQSIALGRPAPFRATDAFAKDGRERYGIDAGTLTRFEAWLAEAADSAEDVFVRAARVYLDVCFTHPFDDGNARAARLALDFVLTRAGCVLRATAPVFALPRAADDVRGGRDLVHTLASCAAKQGPWPSIPGRQHP